MQGLLNLLLEAFIAQRRAGLNSGPDIMYLIRLQCASKQFPVGIAPFSPILAERQIQGMRGNDSVSTASGIDTIAGPSIVTRRGDHTRTDRIELDITHAGEQIVITRDQASFVASFPKRAAFPVRMVHIHNVVTADMLDQSADGFGILRGDHQVDMIGHQHVGVDVATM